MKKTQTPQAKKRLSLLKDCRNTYGENDKSSRSAIRWRKRWVNSKYRRDVKQSLSEISDFDRITDVVNTIERHGWTKYPDMPIGKIFLQDKTQEIVKLLSDAANKDPDWFDKLGRYLCAGDLQSGRIAILMRRARAITIDRNSTELDLNWEDLNLLADFLCQD